MTLPTPVVAGCALAALWLLVVPVTVFVHELGHAAAVRALTGGSPTIIVGGERWRRDGDRLAVLFDHAGWRRRWYGFCRYGSLPSDPRREARFTSRVSRF